MRYYWRSSARTSSGCVKSNEVDKDAAGNQPLGQLWNPDLELEGKWDDGRSQEPPTQLSHSTQVLPTCARHARVNDAPARAQRACSSPAAVEKIPFVPEGRTLPQNPPAC